MVEPQSSKLMTPVRSWSSPPLRLAKQANHAQSPAAPFAVGLQRRHYDSNVRFVQPAVLLIGAAMYIAVIAFSFQLSRGDTVQWNLVIVGAWNLLLLAATVIAIVDGVRGIRARKTRRLATDVLVVKLAAIPFFVLNYFVLAFLFIGGGAIFLFGGFVLWGAAAIGTGLTYLALLSTSVYAWAAIAQLRGERVIGTGLTIAYVIMSLVFVTDIVAGVLLFGHARRRPRLALVVLLLSVGLVVIAFGLVGLFGGFGYVPFQYPSEVDPIAIVVIILFSVGLAVIVPTIIVSVARRSTLRDERQRAAVAVRTSTESDTSDRVFAG